MTKLFIHIKELIQVRNLTSKPIKGLDMNTLPILKNAFLYIVDDVISDFGLMSNLEINVADEIIDCSEKLILPTWIDAHTHLVFANGRENEFVDKINGLSYEEIAANGGGILNSAKQIQETSEEELFKNSVKKIENCIKNGTGALEIKSGYGLSVESELKILRVIQKLKCTFQIPIKATFLGAHAVPTVFKNNKKGYISLIINQMLPKIAEENLADFIDVFCEKNYFSIEETDQLLKAGIQYGLVPKVHVNQFNAIGGVEIATKNKAISVDHLEVLEQEDLIALQNCNTIAVALPACSFFLGIPYTNGKKIIANQIPLALASDFNPGSSPTSNMGFVVSLACIKMKLTPEAAINAATINAAFAMDVQKEVGSICVGKKANFILTKRVASYKSIPYYFAENLIDTVYINGKPN